MRKRTRKFFPESLKEEVAKIAHSGNKEKIANLRKQFDLSYTNIYDWKKQYPAEHFNPEEDSVAITPYHKGNAGLYYVFDTNAGFIKKAGSMESVDKVLKQFVDSGTSIEDISVVFGHEIELETVVRVKTNNK